MRTLATSLIVVCVFLSIGTDSSAVSGHNSWFMAFCNDGDGPLSEWVSTRNEAYLAGRDHERSFKGHRWEVLVQAGPGLIRPTSCALVSDGEKPETVRLGNTCGQCRKFSVSRRLADGTTKSRMFTVNANSRRYFRKIEGAVITVDGESDCGS